MPVTTFILIAALAQTPSAWKAPTVKAYIGQIERAASSPNATARDSGLLNIASQAYQVGPKPNEGLEVFARRVLKRVDPSHPRVKKGQWLLALTKRLYSDLAQRCESLARFETRRRDKAYLSEKAKAFASYATAISGLLRVNIPGVDGDIEPLPIARGSTKKVHGVQVTVIGENISIEQNKRVTFKKHQAPADANRTARGSLMSLLNSFKQHLTYGKLMARSKGVRNRDLGKARLFISGSKPALYLNELLSAAKEAKYSWVYVMVFLPKTGKLAHLDLALLTSRKSKLKYRYVDAKCRDDETMQQCVEHLSEQMVSKGPKKVRLYIR